MQTEKNRYLADNSEYLKIVEIRLKCFESNGFLNILFLGRINAQGFLNQASNTHFNNQTGNVHVLDINKYN